MATALIPSVTVPTGQLASVVGTDGANPIRDDTGLWRWWSLSQIYVGREGANRYVPKIDDYVIRPATFQVWIVTFVDPITLIPTLAEIRPWGMSSSLDTQDILFGVGPGTQAQLLRVYLNTASYPYTLTVDTHCLVGGSLNSYAILYKGGDPSLGGEPVSALYDNTGNFLGVQIPLETVHLDTHDNSVLKTVRQCKTTKLMSDGEVITVIFYSADGIVQSKAQLLLENTTMVRTVDASQKYVTNISLRSPWLSAADENTLSYPLNIPANALGLMGVVHYSDGSELELAVDGSKFSLFGIDGYLSSIVGEKQDLTLCYVLSPGEYSIAGQGMQVDGRVTQRYQLITQDVQPGYTVKLFPYPVWDSVMQGYRLKWWLLNLDRNIIDDVTNYVELATDTGGFDPQGYGYVQRKQANLNLRRVSAVYKPMIHTQIVEITLFGRPGAVDTPWLVSNQPSPNTPAYGREVYVARISANQVNLSGARADAAAWLQEYYSLTYPLIDRRSEINAPTPSHVQVSVDNGANWTEFFISDWNKDLTITGNVTVSGTAWLKWVKKGVGGDIILSISAAVIK